MCSRNPHIYLKALSDKDHANQVKFTTINTQVGVPAKLETSHLSLTQGSHFLMCRIREASTGREKVGRYLKNVKVLHGKAFASFVPEINSI